MAVPKYDKLFNPLLQAMHKLGGSASVSEQEDAVASLLNLSARDVAQIHRGNRSALNYRLAWARNYLKRFGLLENSARGVWTLTPKGAGSKKVSIGQVKKYVKSLDKGAKSNNESDNQDELDFENEGWRDELIQILKTCLQMDLKDYANGFYGNLGLFK